MFFESYIQQAEKLFAAYTGNQPLHLFLKNFFSQHKKLGSRDRKAIADLLYGIYRLGNSNLHLNTREKIGISALLADSMPIPFFQRCFPAYSEFATHSFEEKIEMLKNIMNLQLLTSLDWSSGLDDTQFFRNMFQKPRVFIRIRKNGPRLIALLQERQISFIQENETCLSFDSRIKLQDVLPSDTYVIQDLASQSAGNFFQPEAGEHFWDCCVGSGGKTIQLLDKEIPVQLTVSDIRPLILKQFKLRMQLYHPEQKYNALELDLTSASCIPIRMHSYHKIICDIPCSGSGTWRRSPEQFYFFTPELLEMYKFRQQKILTNVLQYLKPGGCLYYITCSALAEENERIIDTVASGHQVKSDLFNCFSKGGDVLFMASIKI